MPRDKFEQPSPKGLSEEEVNRILEIGTPQEVEKLRQQFDISNEKMELFRQYVQLRKKIIDQAEKTVEERKKTNPEMTVEEQELGLYIEYIEPQVINAIRTLRAKGYNTVSSGFYGDNRQRISFHETTLSEFELPKTLLDFLKTKQVKIYIEPDEIILTCNKFLDIDELKSIWDKIAEDMPDLKGEVKTRQETFKKELPPSE